VGREDWLRVRVTEDGDGLVCRPLAGGSGEIVHFALADGLARVPAEVAELPAGAPVVVHLLV
jgi:molybdopterin biosynthesis enzyme